jgi:hypothetical protein
MTIYNQQPYFDDFDKSKNFTQVLFKPAKSVQVRELNALQSIQHNQVEQFANHIFKHGAKVDGAVPEMTTVDYVTFDAKSPLDNTTLVLTKLNEDYLVGETSGVEAKLFYIAPSISTDPPTIYVNYIKAGTDNAQFTFLDGEIVNVIDSNGVKVYSAKVRCLDCPGSNDKFTKIEPTGKGSIWQIPISTFYVYGNFIEIGSTVIIGEKYSTNVESYKVGLDIISDIVSAENDSTLYDNALGYPNYSADGADRARTYLVPVIRTLNSDDGDTFVVLAKVAKGIIQFLLTKTEYAAIMDTLAERTYDESGNYTVIPFTAKYREHLKTSEDDPNGRYLAEEGGDETKLIATLSSGKAYIKGYQVEKISEFEVEIDKTRDLATFRNYYSQFGNIAYLKATLQTNSGVCSSKTTLPSVFSNDSVEIWDGVFSGGVPTGAHIGNLKIYDVIIDPASVDNSVYQFFITDIEIFDPVTHPFDTAKTLYSTNSVPFLATLVSTTITEATKKALIWEIGKEFIQSTYDIDNPTQKSLGYVKRKKLNGSLNGSGIITFTAGSGEVFIASDFKTTIAATSTGVNSISVPVVLTSGTCTITPSTITVNLGVPNAGKTLTLIQNVAIAVGQEKKKTFTPQISSAGDSGPLVDDPEEDGVLMFTIPFSDLYSVSKIYRYATATPNTKIDVTDLFTWNSGQKDFGYLPAEFFTPSTTETELWKTNEDEFIVEFIHFEHGTGEFFSVDSYADAIDDPSIAFSYGDIPVYKSSAGVTYNLRDCLDFRQLLLDPLVEVAASQPAQWSVITSDVSYYLPRTDLLVINAEGEVYQKKGTSSTTPKIPKIEDTGSEMALFEIQMRPYVFDIQSDLVSKIIENKRYTMRDIGRIENRINRLEEMITLSLLETSAENFSIKDENGLDRFKNGFVVDNFVNFQAADVGAKEFKASINSNKKFMTPRVIPFNIKMILDSTTTSNIRLFGNVVMGDFNEEIYEEQPYSSKTMSVNPYFIFNKIGTMILTPNMDSWTNISYATPVIFNDIRLTELQIDNRVQNGTWMMAEAMMQQWNQRPFPWGTSTTTMEERVESLTTEAVTNVSLNPYMRAATVIFYATGMMANTRLYCYFDKVNVSKYCYPLIANAVPGTPIITSASGNVAGVFNLPNNEFFAGEKTFRLTNVADDSRDEDELRTSAEQLFYSQGMNAEKQQTTINIRHQTSTTTLNPPPAGNGNNRAPPPGRRDPVAQTFTASKDMFVTSIEVYFQSADPNNKLFLQIKDTLNGYPGPTLLGEQNFLGSSVKVSENASVPTKITFPVPVFLVGGKDYAFIVGGSSPEAFLWVSKLGERDATNPNILIDKQPSLGSLFKSQNNSTWTASQNEDVKFKINIAKFKSKTTVIGMKNDNLRDQFSVFNPFETEIGSNKVRVRSQNHGMVVGDKTNFDIGNQTWIGFTQTSGILNIGHSIVTATGSGTVKNIRKTATPNLVEVQLNDITGYFLAAQAFTAAAFTPVVPSTYFVESLLGKPEPPALVNAVSGTVNTTFNDDVNGIPFGELNQQLTVSEVGSINSYVVTTTSNATEYGFGGGNTTLNNNKRFEAFCASGNYKAISCDENWRFTATQHSQNGIFESDDYVKCAPKFMVPGAFIYHNKPFKIASPINETIKLGGTNKSVGIIATFTASTDYVSPVLDFDSFSMIALANTVDFHTEATMAVAPNSTKQWVPETAPEFGVASYKYITRDVELETPAYDLKILIDVYKQEYADFDIYIKTQSPSSSVPLQKVNWVLVNTKKDFSSKDLTDFREVEIDSAANGPAFSAFKVKVVGRTKNTANPPLFKNLRVIAIT